MDVIASAGAAAPSGSKRFIIVANRTGGQGKTLLTHLLATCLRRADPLFHVMCADSLEDVGGGVMRSKLGRAVMDTIELGAGPSAADVQLKPRLALDFWDGVAVPLMDATGSGCIVDVGANVVDSIIEWARSADLAEVFGDQVVTDVVVPVVATPKSIADARAVVSSLSRDGGLPMRSIFLVRNEWQATFERLEGGEDYAAVAAAVARTGGSVATIPRCVSDLLRHAEDAHMFFGDVLDLGHSDIANAFSMGLVKASREKRSFAEWFAAAKSSLAQAGLCDPVPVGHGADVSGEARRSTLAV